MFSRHESGTQFTWATQMVVSRLCAPIRRRMYSVPCPNYVWHINGNQKLVRWRIVLHHAVDGFSRFVVFAGCSTNNKAHTVLQLYQGKGYMYMWDETVAKHGSSEVASCLKHFFQACCSGARSMLSYSVGCGGQNKNLTIVGLYNELHLSGVYDTLNHKFLTRGHTFLRNDTDFTKIEKGKASATVYLLSDWFSGVKQANHKSPFEVAPMQQEDFMTFKDHISSKYTNHNFSASGSTFHDIHWLNFGWGEELDHVTKKVTLVYHPNSLDTLHLFWWRTLNHEAM